jgi:hypothetical protein
LNSLKTEEQNVNKQSITNEKIQTKKGTLLLLSVPETSEEKELSWNYFIYRKFCFFGIFRFLIEMGWNDDMNYQITDKDKEEYEKRIKLLPKVFI